MVKLKPSAKHIQISKANQAVIVATAIAVCITVFGIFTGKVLLERRSHQAKVIAKKEAALKQLKENVDAKNKIVASYKVLVSKPDNIIGGSSSPTATGPNDGDNARLILDALPSTYDFPALATTIEYMLRSNGFAIDSLTGTDDEVNQAANTLGTEPVEMPISFGVRNTDYDGTVKVIDLLDKSIRPFVIDSLSLEKTGTGKVMKLTIEAKTYYLPARSFTITKEVIK